MSDESAAVVAMIERWTANVPPTPYDGPIASGVALGTPEAAAIDAIQHGLRLAYRRGYNKALGHVQKAVENGGHLMEPPPPAAPTRREAT